MFAYPYHLQTDGLNKMIANPAVLLRGTILKLATILFVDILR